MVSSRRYQRSSQLSWYLSSSSLVFRIGLPIGLLVSDNDKQLAKVITSSQGFQVTKWS